MRPLSLVRFKRRPAGSVSEWWFHTFLQSVSQWWLAGRGAVGGRSLAAADAPPVIQPPHAANYHCDTLQA